VIPIDLPRPRSFETQSSPRFTELRSLVIEVIHEESLKAVASELAATAAS